MRLVNSINLAYVNVLVVSPMMQIFSPMPGLISQCSLPFISAGQLIAVDMKSILVLEYLYCPVIPVV